MSIDGAVHLPVTSTVSPPFTTPTHGATTALRGLAIDDSAKRQRMRAKPRRRKMMIGNEDDVQFIASFEKRDRRGRCSWVQR